MPPNKGIRATKDGGLFINPAALDTASEDASEGSSIRIPQVTTELGAGFGDEIADVDRKFAAEREPVAQFLTYGVAGDVFDKWLVIDDPTTEGGDPEIDKAVQKPLTQLKAQNVMREALEYERIYGWSLLIGSFNDVSDYTELDRPLVSGSQLLQLSVYPKTNVHVWTKDINQNSARYGEPVVYRIDRGDGFFNYVHYTRCYRLETRSSGKSVLDPVWDDVTCGRNIRWGTAQYIYRIGGGFPVIHFPPGTTQEQLEDWMDSDAFSHLMSRTYIGITGDMDFKFEGAAGRTLDPQPFFKTNDEQIAKATGIPQPKLVGAQSGAVVGAELNQQEYYKVISRIQVSLEEMVRWVVDKLYAAGQIAVAEAHRADVDSALWGRMKRWLKTDASPKPPAFEYEVNWTSAFELSDLDEKQIELLHEQANQVRLEYMTVDEVRGMNELKPLPNGEGAKIRQAQPFQPFGQQEEEGEGEGLDQTFTVIQHAGVKSDKGNKGDR